MMNEKLVISVDMKEYTRHVTTIDHVLSTKGVEELDQQIHEMIVSALERSVKKDTERFYKGKGDGAHIIIDNPDPSTAVIFAKELHKEAEQFNQRKSYASKDGKDLGPDFRRDFRVAATIGEISNLELSGDSSEAEEGISNIRFATDISGLALTEAERLESHCDAGQLIVTNDVWGRLGDSLKNFFGKEEDVFFKNIKKPCKVRRMILPSLSVAGEEDEERLYQLQVGAPLLNGKITLNEMIDRAGHAQVWRASYTGRKSEVAVKILNRQLGSDSKLRELFFQGADKMASIEHPGIVEVIENRCEEDGFCFFVMEYVPGGNIQDKILDSGMGMKQIFEVIRQAGEALLAAHEAGVFHLNLKPGNILLDADGDAKLTDLDLSPLRSALKRHEISLFSPPEHASKSTTDSRDDVYSLAMIAVFAFSEEELPAFSKSPKRRKNLISKLKINHGTKLVLLKATEEKVENRWPNIEKFLSAWRSAQQAGGSLRQHFLYRAKRLQDSLAAATFLLLIAMSLVIFSLWMAKSALEPEIITVGTKNFFENLIASEIVFQWVKGECSKDYSVQRGDPVVDGKEMFEDLVHRNAGGVDLYVEYSGTLLRYLLGMAEEAKFAQDGPQDFVFLKELLNDRVQNEYPNVEVFEFLGYESQYSLVILPEAPKALVPGTARYLILGDLLLLCSAGGNPRAGVARR